MSGLGDYAAKHAGDYQPVPDPERANTVRAVTSRKEVTDLMERIAEQIRQGQEPHLTLCTAVRAIALLTSDTDWEACCLHTIDKIYAGTAQLSLLEDAEAIEAGKRQEARRQFAQKTEKRLKHDISQCQKLIGLLQEGLKVTESIKP